MESPLGPYQVLRLGKHLGLKAATLLAPATGFTGSHHATNGREAGITGQILAKTAHGVVRIERQDGLGPLANRASVELVQRLLDLVEQTIDPQSIRLGRLELLHI
jgi:hypothetical protein